MPRKKEAVNDTMDNIKKLVEDIPYLQIPSGERRRAAGRRGLPAY